jgi:hypothetical protein
VNVAVPVGMGVAVCGFGMQAAKTIKHTRQITQHLIPAPFPFF